MTYDEIEPGQQIKINVPNPKFCVKGTVKAKEILTIAGKQVERVYVDTERNERRLCVPSVLEPVS